MAGSVNKVILIGNLGKDPEIRHLSNGTAVTTVPLATSETFRDKTSGEMREITEWHNIVMWRNLAEIAEKYLKKGSKIFIEGKLRTRSWEDKDGHMRYTTEVVADQMTMLDRPQEDKKAPDNINQADPKPMDDASSDFTSETSDDDLPF